MLTLLRDLRYGARMLMRSPGFAAVAVLSLALGIGVNTAIFSLVNAVFLRPLPVEDADRIVSIATTDEKNPGHLPVSRDNFVDLSAQTQSFDEVFAYAFVPASLQGDEEAEFAIGQAVTGNYFPALGVQAALGHTIDPEHDGAPGADPVLVLSHDFWEMRFAGDPEVLGTTIEVNGQPFVVVGVAPDGFTGTNVMMQPKFWTPMSNLGVLDSVQGRLMGRRGLTHFGYAKLAEGVSLEDAQADVSTVGARLAAEYPEVNEGRNFALTPLAEATFPPQMRGVLVVAGIMLMSIVGLVLLIACANVANLLLTRANARRKEIAIRQALGASPRRLFRQMLTESLLLSGLGGLLGLLIAAWAKDLLWKLQPTGPMAFTLDISLDARVLAFTAVLALGTGILFGLAPALRAGRADLVPGLKAQAVRNVLTSRRPSLGRALVTVQVAFSVVALIAAALFLRSLGNAQEIDPGFDTEHTFGMIVEQPVSEFEPARAASFFEGVVDEVESMPGVESAAVTESPPFMGNMLRTTFIDDANTSAQDGVLIDVNGVSPGYFETLAIPLLRGRDFAPTDDADAPPVAIINRTMADRYWGEGNAVGKTFRFIGMERKYEVVGVVADIKYQTLGEEPKPYIYAAAAQDPRPRMALMVRTSGDPQAMLAGVPGQVAEHPGSPSVHTVQAVSGLLDNSLWGARVSALLLSSFAGLALVLAAIGIYGLMSYTVSRRTREVGIRIALGARPRDVLKLLMAQSARLILGGVGLGILLAFGLSQALADLLYDVSPADPVAYVVAVGLLTGVGLLASWIPGRRATRIDPMLALREE
jgi:putative ABC transport system permease protein